jgi:hypothetical protein
VYVSIKEENEEKASMIMISVCRKVLPPKSCRPGCFRSPKKWLSKRISGMNNRGTNLGKFITKPGKKYIFTFGPRADDTVDSE